MQVQLLSLPPIDSWGCSSTGEHSARIRAMRVRFPSLPPRGRHQQGLARGCKPRRTGSVTRGGLSLPPRVDRGPGLRTSVKQFDPARWYCCGTWPNWKRHPAQTRQGGGFESPRTDRCARRKSGRQRDAARRGLLPSGLRDRVRWSAPRWCCDRRLKPADADPDAHDDQNLEVEGSTPSMDARPCSSAVEHRAIDLGWAWLPKKAIGREGSGCLSPDLHNRSGELARHPATRAGTRNGRPSTRRPPPGPRAGPQSSASRAGPRRASAPVSTGIAAAIPEDPAPSRRRTDPSTPLFLAPLRTHQPRRGLTPSISMGGRAPESRRHRRRSSFPCCSSESR